MRLEVAAAGNANENINLIDAQFQAEALRALRGKDCGVLDNSFFSDANPRGDERDENVSFMWELTAENAQNITVGRGMATAYGYDIKNKDEVTFTVAAPSAGSKFVFVFLSWDLSNPTEALGEIDIHDNGNAATWTPQYQDNLITSPIGKYQMPLYRIELNTSGQVVSTAEWTALGVETITGVHHAQNAEFSYQAKYADDDTSETIGERLQTLVARVDSLGFRQTTITVAGIGGQTITRQGNYVLINVVADITPDMTWYQNYFPNDKVLCTLPELFRPKVDRLASVCIVAKDGIGIAASSVSVGTDGAVKTIINSGPEVTNKAARLVFCVGFEAPPIPIEER